MISVCPADGLRLCAERGVRLVTTLRGESAPACASQVEGGAPGLAVCPSVAAAVGAMPPPPPPCGAHSSGPGCPADHGRKRALCLQMSSCIQIAGSDFSWGPPCASLSLLCNILVSTKTR